MEASQELVLKLEAVEQEIRSMLQFGSSASKVAFVLLNGFFFKREHIDHQRESGGPVRFCRNRDRNQNRVAEGQIGRYWNRVQEQAR